MSEEQGRWKNINLHQMKQAVVEYLKSNSGEIHRLLKDPMKAFRTLRNARKKGSKITLGSFVELKDEFLLMLEMAKAYIRREYRTVPVKSILAILGMAVYVLNPIDVIPDVIPGIGYIDDAFVVALVLKQVRADLQQFRDWQGQTEVEWIYDGDVEYIDDEDIESID